MNSRIITIVCLASILVLMGSTVTHAREVSGIERSGPVTESTSSPGLQSQGNMGFLESTIVVQDYDDPNSEWGGPASGFYVAPVGSITANGHATWTYSNNAAQADNFITYKPPLPQCGNWEAYAYMAFVNNGKPDTTHAPYTIRYRGGQTVVYVNQASYDTNPPPTNRWHSLGIYPFSANANTAGEYIRVGDNTGEGYPGQRNVNFDDLQWVFRGENDTACLGTPPSGEVVVLDKNDPNTEWGGSPASLYDAPAGSITASGHATWTYSNSYAQADNFIRYKPPLPRCGNWEAYAFIPFVNHGKPDTAHAPYTIRYRGGQTVVYVNQASYDTNPPPTNRWHSLGTYPFSANANAAGEYILLGDNTGEGDPVTATNQRSVNFDDLKWVFRGENAIACTVVGDSIPPGGAVLTPANNATIGPSSVSFTASASDNAGGSGVGAVVFSIHYDGGWHEIGRDSTAPYGVGWNVPGGLASQQLIFTITVVDRAGNQTRDPGGYRYATYIAPSLNPIVREARLDSGMPYDTNRGCPSPYQGCGYRYHGFLRGVCTDLVLDAYNAGLGFNIQQRLRADTWSAYQHYESRWVPDMWTYFQRNQQLLSKTEPYHVGDIAFFDGDADGVLDHAGIISQVGSRGEPIAIMDSRGVEGIPARERLWSTILPYKIRDHGRVVHSRPGRVPQSDAGLQMLVISTTTPGIQLRLRDDQGRWMGADYQPDLIANNPETFIPYLPRTLYDLQGQTQIISAAYPLSNTNHYQVDITSAFTTSYGITIQTFQDGHLTQSATITGTLADQANQTVDLLLSAGTLGFDSTRIQPVSTAILAAEPAVLTLSIPAGASAATAVLLYETTGHLGAEHVRVTPSDFVAPVGETLPASSLHVTTTTTSIAPGGSTAIQISAEAGSVEPGVYAGRLSIAVGTEIKQTIPVFLRVYTPSMIYLPVLQR